MSEQSVISPLLMDRSDPIGNSVDSFGRRSLHTFVSGGSIVVGNATVPPDYDEGIVAYPNTLTEVYTYKKAGVTLRTVTIVYTDTSKNFISSWTIV